MLFHHDALYLWQSVHCATVVYIIRYSKVCDVQRETTKVDQNAKSEAAERA